MSATKLYQGETWQRVWALKNKLKQPIDLTGATATLQLRDAKKILIHSASSVTGEIIIEGLAGKATMTIDETVTADWLPGTYAFKFRITYPAGVVKVYESAPLVVLEY